jgi:hypothetical protein
VASRTIAEKLLIRPGHRIAAVNPPDDYIALVGGLPAGVLLAAGPGPDTDLVHLFVRDQAELAETWPAIAPVVPPEAILWISYPKRGPGVTTDLTRDQGWRPVREAGFDPVSQVAIDERWSALRWRRDPALRAAREARGARVGRD